MRSIEATKTAESEEPRASAERNPGDAPEAGTQRPAQSESGRSRIRAAARKDRTIQLNNRLHHLTVPLLWEAYDRLERKAAPGVDGVDRYGYGQNLLSNLVQLHERIHTGPYRAQPVERRVCHSGQTPWLAATRSAEPGELGQTARIGPGYPATKGSVVIKVIPSTVAWAIKRRSKGSLCSGGRFATARTWSAAIGNSS